MKNSTTFKNMAAENLRMHSELAAATSPRPHHRTPLQALVCVSHPCLTPYGFPPLH